MKFNALGYRLPRFLSSVLFGDRDQFGTKADPTDACWIEYQSTLQQFYNETQGSTSGNIVSNAGYRILKDTDFANKSILEIGPGGLKHIKFWNNSPQKYVLGDINQDFLEAASKKLSKHNVSYEARTISRDAEGALPCEDNEFDIIITFFSLEHLQPIEEHLKEMRRVLKPGGVLTGAIPAEGGLAWGLGRFMTTRRWMKKNTTINPDKIICWEHVNFSDQILNTMDELFELQKISFWPLKLPIIDINLIIKFIYIKNREPS